MWAHPHSTQITPSGFTWIKPSELCHSLLRQHHDSQQFVVVDTRTEEEAVGGCVCGAIRSSTNLSQSEIEQLVVHYRAGRRIIFYCLRSQSRAPLAAQKLLQVIVARGLSYPRHFYLYTYARTLSTEQRCVCLSRFWMRRVCVCVHAEDCFCLSRLLMRREHTHAHTHAHTHSLVYNSVSVCLGY